MVKRTVSKPSLASVQVERGEVHVGGQVLPARPGERVEHQLVLEIAPDGTPAPPAIFEAPPRCRRTPDRPCQTGEPLSVVDVHETPRGHEWGHLSQEIAETGEDLQDAVVREGPQTSRVERTEERLYLGGRRVRHLAPGLDETRPRRLHGPRGSHGLRLLGLRDLHIRLPQGGPSDVDQMHRDGVQELVAHHHHRTRAGAGLDEIRAPADVPAGGQRSRRAAACLSRSRGPTSTMR